MLSFSVCTVNWAHIIYMFVRIGLLKLVIIMRCETFMNEINIAIVRIVDP